MAIGANNEPGLLSEEAIVNEVLPDVSVQSLKESMKTATSIRIGWRDPLQTGAEEIKVCMRQCYVGSE